MKHKFALFLLTTIIISIIFGTSCSSSKITFENNKIELIKLEKIDLAVQSKSGKSFIWEVNSDKNKNIVYILGSIHVGKESLYPLDSTIERAYKNSSVLAVEADVTKVDLASSSLMFQKAMYTDGKTLKDVLPKNLYDKVKERFKDSLYDMSVDKFKPWMVNMLIEALNIQELNYDTDKGIDLHFLNKAHDEKKEIKEIESVDFQLNMIENFSDELTYKLLEENLNYDASELSDEIEKMFDFWVVGNFSEIEKLVLSDMPDDAIGKEYNKKMLLDRNIGMKNAVIEYLNSGKPHLVIVGSAHFVGENGIVNLLKNEGYTVIQK